MNFCRLKDGDSETKKSLVTKHKVVIEQADSVLWNYGLHALHLRPCREGLFHNLAEYRHDLHCMAASVTEVAKGKPVFYKLTNTITG